MHASLTEAQEGSGRYIQSLSVTQFRHRLQVVVNMLTGVGLQVWVGITAQAFAGSFTGTRFRSFRTMVEDSKALGVQRWSQR